MTLPDFDSNGDLPVGIHRATLDEIVRRFGGHTPKRRDVTERLRQVLVLAQSTGALQRAVVYGSYVTAKPEPRDVDIVIVLRDDFRVELCSHEQLAIFDHERGEMEIGASVFWIRPALIVLQSVDEFLEGWQIKRGGGRRGIVEVIL
jgi:PAS domain-containing protein